MTLVTKIGMEMKIRNFKISHDIQLINKRYKKDSCIMLPTSDGVNPAGSYWLSLYERLILIPIEEPAKTTLSTSENVQVIAPDNTSKDTLDDITESECSENLKSDGVNLGEVSAKEDASAELGKSEKVSIKKPKKRFKKGKRGLLDE